MGELTNLRSVLRGYTPRMIPRLRYLPFLALSIALIGFGCGDDGGVRDAIVANLIPPPDSSTPDTGAGDATTGDAAPDGTAGDATPGDATPGDANRDGTAADARD